MMWCGSCALGGKKMRLIDANFAQHIADVELSPDGAGTVQWVLSHTPTIDPESLRPKGRWIEHEWAEEENGLLVSNFECSKCHIWESKTSDYCPNCGAKMEG